MLPTIISIVGNFIRIAGFALVAKGIVNQDVVDQSAMGIAEIIVGGTIYTISQIWSKKQVTKENKIEAVKQSDRVFSNVTKVLNNVTLQVSDQVASQVPVEMAKGR